MTVPGGSAADEITGGAFFTVKVSAWLGVSTRFTNMKHQYLVTGPVREFLERDEEIPVMRDLIPGCYCHHEAWDGSGYPLGKKGEDIPLVGRIVALADVFDALTSRRPYKPAFPLDKAVEIMMAGRGTHFDPIILDLFLDNIDLVEQIQKEHQDEIKVSE